MASELEGEVDRNFDAFVAVREDLLADHAGDWVLMRHGRVADFFSSDGAALLAGRMSFPDGLYSIQEVADRPADLGFFSHAVNTRLA